MESLDATNRRKRLFHYLDDVLRLSQRKFNYERTDSAARLSYGRLLVSTVDSYRKLLDSVQIEDFAKEVQLIKEKIGAKET